MLMQEAQELQQHPDVKRALPKKRLDDSIAQVDRGETVDGETLLQETLDRLKNHIPKVPAYWKKIEQPEEPQK